MKKVTYFLVALISVSATMIHAESESFKKFRSDYSLLDMDLLNNVGEKTDVKDFVYQKDVAMFTFHEGVIHLLRYFDGRPTTAIFIGRGHATIDVPSPVERRSLLSVSGADRVDEDFEICFIRMADDFDLKLKEKFSFEQEELKWKNFTQVKQAAGEIYFKPIIEHTYDSYFQLLRSLYERSQDGMFWMNFNRYCFTYDPNRPEQVVISYEFEKADIVVTEAARFQKSGIGVYDNRSMSNIAYPTTSISKQATLQMGGLDGARLDNAQATMKLVINADSLKYLSTFIHFNLKEDSIYLDGQPVDYYRRKDFNFIGIILPEYKYKGDTLELTYWYRGKDFDYVMPYVENPAPTIHSFTFTIPKGFNYLMPDKGAIEPADKGRERFETVTTQEYNRFLFQSYASGYDTIAMVSDIGMTINFLKGKHITKAMDCFVPDKIYQTTIMDAFNFMSGRMGGPISTFELFVYPENYNTMPGLVEIPQVVCYEKGGLDALGGFNIFAGHSMAKQWFGSLVKPATDRECWLKDAAAEYLSLLFIQNSSSGAPYYSNLLFRRDSLYTVRGLDRDRPLATGDRVSSIVKNNKGVWMFHMLRSLMLDIENKSEQTFFKFLRELSLTVNNGVFTNDDFIKLAEKHYGGSLDWFFNQWLYDFSYPEFEVEYQITERSGDYFIDGTVATKGVGTNFQMPVLMSIETGGGEPEFRREMVNGSLHKFELGPFKTKPTAMRYNELYSVLSKDKVKKL